MVSLVPAAICALCGGLSVSYIFDRTPETCFHVSF